MGFIQKGPFLVQGKNGKGWNLDYENEVVWERLDATVNRIRASEGFRVTTFRHLMDEVANVTISNRIYEMFYRGQSKDYKNNQAVYFKDRIAKTTIYPTICRPDKNATFALRNSKIGYVYVFGLPYPNQSISYFSDLGIVLIKLQNIIQTNAIRPRYQEGFLVGKYSIRPTKTNGDDLANRMVAKFLVDNTDGRFWDKYFPPMPSAWILKYLYDHHCHKISSNIPEFNGFRGDVVTISDLAANNKVYDIECLSEAADILAKNGHINFEVKNHRQPGDSKIHILENGRQAVKSSFYKKNYIKKWKDRTLILFAIIAGLFGLVKFIQYIIQ
jgi:hypothetical protein